MSAVYCPVVTRKHGEKQGAELRMINVDVSDEMKRGSTSKVTYRGRCRMSRDVTDGSRGSVARSLEM